MNRRYLYTNYVPIKSSIKRKWSSRLIKNLLDTHSQKIVEMIKIFLCRDEVEKKLYGNDRSASSRAQSIIGSCNPISPITTSHTGKLMQFIRYFCNLLMISKYSIHSHHPITSCYLSSFWYLISTASWDWWWDHSDWVPTKWQVKTQQNTRLYFMMQPKVTGRPRLRAWDYKEARGWLQAELSGIPGLQIKCNAMQRRVGKC